MFVQWYGCGNYFSLLQVLLRVWKRVVDADADPGRLWAGSGWYVNGYGNLYCVTEYLHFHRFRSISTAGRVGKKLEILLTIQTS